ncbi:MAG TPA: acyl-CoA dehydrogenase family protein [Steroidobacteraceae bacterium]|nr:acyl-CoA dehydrogenase family protein [Steroidobacteraceae bacterium]
MQTTPKDSVTEAGRPQGAAERLAAIKAIAANVAAKHAADVDSKARFPTESVAALKEAGFFSALVPLSFGGWGCSMREAAGFCSALAQGCSSSAMVLAMHYSQLACITRHGLDTDFFRAFAKEIVARQLVLASMTSEVGTGGDTRSSICAVVRADGRFTLTKEATTGSYCAHADAILVTCKRAPDAAAGDQVLVLVHKADAKLTQTTTWDTMGMRGTCSPGFKLESSGAEAQILPVPFADISTQSMVPYSHILWSALWHGIAADAIAKAAGFVRAEARRKPGTIPPAAPRLARVVTEIQAMRHNWQTLATEFDEAAARDDGAQHLQTLGWALKMNNLKIRSSELAPQIVHEAMQIIGVLAYKNDSPFSVARHYRDALSGALMISNDRIVQQSSSMLLVFKDE